MLSYIVYGCQDIYKPTKADGDVFRVIITIAAGGSEMVIHQASVQNSVEALGLGDIVNDNKNSDKKLYMCSSFLHSQKVSLPLLYHIKHALKFNIGHYIYLHWMLSTNPLLCR